MCAAPQHRAFLCVFLAATALSALGPSGAIATRTPAATLSVRTSTVPILMYHRIDEPRATLPEITRRLTVDPRTFAQQMAWMKAHRWHAITQRRLYEALVHGARLPARPVVITFDDGYRNVYENALPVLARLRMRATAYVITERISGPDPNFLTWRMLRALERGGVEIGSHTVSHADLPTLDDARAFFELAGSKRALERRLGHQVPWLAYPFGREDARVVRLARRAGYLLATTTQPGWTQRADDPLRLHRYRVLDSTGVAGLAAYLRSAARAVTPSG